MYVPRSAAAPRDPLSILKGTIKYTQNKVGSFSHMNWHWIHGLILQTCEAALYTC